MVDHIIQIKDHNREKPPRCLIPDFDGAYFSLSWKEALWPGFTRERHDDRGSASTADRRLLANAEREQYKIVKRA